MKLARVAAVVLIAVTSCAHAPSELDAGPGDPRTCPGAGTWRRGPRLTDPREQAAVLRLADGRAIAIGGHHIDPPAQRDLDSVEMFDPATETWSPTTPMLSVRGSTNGLTARLGDGRILTAEQQGFGTIRTRIPAEIFDPATETWSATPLMSDYANGALVPLPDGGALVMGGSNWDLSVPYQNAQRYDLTTGQWRAVGPMLAPRLGHSAIAVGDHVLVMGGHDVYHENPGPPFIATVELFDPTTDTFRAVGAMTTGRWSPAVAVLADGRVLACGGDAADGRSAELYDPSTETWTSTGSMSEGRGHASLTLLADGRVLVAGGAGARGDLASAEIYDPSTGTWSSAGSMPDVRRLHSAVLLENGEVLVVGGFHYFQLSMTAIYTPCRSTGD